MRAAVARRRVLARRRAVGARRRVHCASRILWDFWAALHRQRQRGRLGACGTLRVAERAERLARAKRRAGAIRERTSTPQGCAAAANDKLRCACLLVSYMPLALSTQRLLICTPKRSPSAASGPGETTRPLPGPGPTRAPLLGPAVGGLCSCKTGQPLRQEPRDAVDATTINHDLAE